jgi:hypothetical protein
MANYQAYETVLDDMVKRAGYVPVPPSPLHTHSVAGTNLPSHTHAVSATQAGQQRADRWSEQRLQEMLSSRLGWGWDMICPFKKVVPCRVTDETVAVFVVTNKDYVVIEDDAMLYPSDSLITQLRILMEAL